MSATDWKQSKTYCYKCRRWHTHLPHKKCPKGSSGSEVLLNIASFREGCNKCGETWPLENSILYCSCGNVQRTEYTDTALIAGHDDRIIMEDKENNLVYMLRSTGVVVVGQRTFPGVAVHESPPLISPRKTSSKPNCFQVIGCLVTIIVVIGLGIGLFQFIAHSSSGYSTSDLQALASGSQLAGYWDNQGNEHVDYISADGHVHELYYTGKQWADSDLTAKSKGTSAIPGSALDGYPGNGNSQHVNFISANHHIHELYFNPKTAHWADSDLTASSKGKDAIDGSLLVGYMGSSGSVHVNYIGADHHVYELYYSGSSWTDNDLTALSKGKDAATDSGLAGYTGKNGSIHVNFIGTDQHIHELYFGDNWVDNDLTALSKGNNAVAGSALAGYTGSDSSVHVNFISANQHVHELYFNPKTGHWADNDLTALSKGTTAAAGSALVGCWSSSSVEHVNFIGADQHIHELYYSGNWVDNDLTTKTKGTAPATGS